VGSDDLNTLEPTKRFSNRVGYYVRARPGYPPGIVDLLARGVGLRAGDRLADIGSGTGLLSRVFLDRDNVVLGVEPNPEMRLAGEEQLAVYENFQSIDGTAEATTLAGGSVNGVIAGQAFHWFDPARARAEFRRILVPGGWSALIWNERRTDGSGFDQAYEALVRQYTTDRKTAEKRGGSVNVRDAVAAFFGEGNFVAEFLENHQDLDLNGAIARVLSSSYMPMSGPKVDDMLGDLVNIFQQFQNDGKIRIGYLTRVYYGKLN
jgi:SAM-dependent methyltransferase